MGLHHTYRGIRVLDLSENIAGPLACMILADLGADVIKIERIDGGDSTRSLPPQREGTGTVFSTVNRNKRSVALNLASETGRDAVLRLARTADVVVESFRPGVADRLGLGFDDVTAVNDKVVYCSISAFGRGPLGHDRPGYDALVQAFTGIMSLTGDPDGRPARTAPSLIDISTGMWAGMSIMAALANRSHGDGPVRLESTLIDSGLFMMCHQIIGLVSADFQPQRLGSAAPSTAPYREYLTSDGSIMVAAATDRLFQRLCSAMETESLAQDPRFATVTDRVQHRHDLDTELEKVFSTRPSSFWLEKIATAGVPVGPVHSLGEALAHPLTLERRLIIDDPASAQIRLPLDQSRDLPLMSPPNLGEHTEEVLREVGFSPDEIRALVPAESAHL
ncbi:CaiB/BaiF CoA transferase family protein [Rhodococcus rhodochrous]|uniref:CoA transferase n=1 Tax=Rhodococcus rhodochrous TaxID=1829 RepID=A0AA46WWK2_RHORH|nr:CoA transferase [Rhodococcus rhodochrous]UZF45705.1 CoA transferase [Rhodococcus rhodochrous]